MASVAVLSPKSHRYVTCPRLGPCGLTWLSKATVIGAVPDRLSAFSATFGTAARARTNCCFCADRPSSSVTLSVTLYSPNRLYVCVAFALLLVFDGPESASPKSHAYVRSPAPRDSLSNFTRNGALPSAGAAMKLATTSPGCTTSI